MSFVLSRCEVAFSGEMKEKWIMVSEKFNLEFRANDKKFIYSQGDCDCTFFSIICGYFLFSSAKSSGNK